MLLLSGAYVAGFLRFLETLLYQQSGFVCSWKRLYCIRPRKVQYVSMHVDIRRVYMAGYSVYVQWVMPALFALHTACTPPVHMETHIENPVYAHACASVLENQAYIFLGSHGGLLKLLLFG